VEDGEVGQRPPEENLALRVERNAEGERDGGDERVEPEPALEFLRVEVDAEGRRVDVRHVHQEHGRHPRPVRRLVFEHPGARAHPQQRERHERAPEKDGQIDARRKEPPPARVGGGRRGALCQYVYSACGHVCLKSRFKISTPRSRL
jgi:hypothetical protein